MVWNHIFTNDIAGAKASFLTSLELDRNHQAVQAGDTVSDDGDERSLPVILISAEFAALRESPLWIHFFE